MTTAAKQDALAANYEAFEQMLPGLLQQAPGKYALLRDRQLVGTFDTASAAHSAGSSRFDDGLFSVQKIKEGAVSLGFFSYARYCRAA
jgi:hypothetical protein